MKSAKFGFIGAGNIATAIIKGILSKGDIKPDEIYIYDVSDEKVQELSKYSVKACGSSEELTQICDYIFLTVKPQHYFEVLTAIKPFVAGKCLVDVAAGITIDFIKATVGFDCKVIRVMPNTPLLLGEGASALVFEPPVTKEEFDVVFEIFQSGGLAVVVDEKDINTVIAVSGSSPAYIFKFAAAVADTAQKSGLDYQIALALISQTLAGSAKMLTESGYTPEELIRMVSSPGGTTLAALAKLDELHFDDTIAQAMDACVKRSAQLAK